MIDEIRTQYREIRRQVYEQATAPIVPNERRHAENKNLFQHQVTALCNQANLARYDAATLAARTSLWHHLWTKNRYAGIRSQIATTEITQLTELFDNFSWFSDAGWNIQAVGHQVQEAGTGDLAMSFLERTGHFAGKQTIGNVPKLKKIVAVARRFKQHFDESPNAPALHFVTQGRLPDDVWTIQEQLIELGYGGHLTALHFMMDVGFQVIKPDAVISRLFLDWGWLHFALPSLPADVAREDLIGEGKYGTKYLYTKPAIYRPIINLAREIVRGMDAKLLAADIDWATLNPIREFDIFVVKSGQLPEREFGIERRLYS